MILKSVRVMSFKCIEDSEEFSVDRVTCLVGKNESGKTALLQALHKLNPETKEKAAFDYVEEYPRRQLSNYEEQLKVKKIQPANVLQTIWELTETEQKAVTEVLGPKALKSNKIRIAKGYDNVQRWEIDLDERAVVEHLLQSSGLFQEELQLLKDAQTVAELVQKLSSASPQSERQIAFLASLQKKFPESSPVRAASQILKPGFPVFLYFSQYRRLPGEMSLTDFQQKKQAGRLTDDEQVFPALLTLAGTTPEEIQNITKFEPLVAKLEAVSSRLTQEIFAYWSQNKHLDVEFRFDNARPEDPPPFNSGYVFRTRIKNRRHGVSVSFNERSSGFVWFFSFLVWFSQVRKTYGENLVILLDEPGLSLHARAQADLLRYINEKLRPHYQVIYTTHSPFMVDPDHLLSARTVEDVVVNDLIEGTKVGDEVLSTDADTVFPLQASLGYDITQTLFVGKNVLLVEGPSDLLYLKWFSQELKAHGREALDPRWVITPCGGIEKIAGFLTLFGGNKLHVAVFTDLHEGQKTKLRNLRESELLREGHVFTADMYVKQAEADIEDVIGRSTYVSLVNQCYGLDGGNALPAVKPTGAPMRVLVEVQNHFAILPTEVAEFDHYLPASFLVENAGQLRKSLPGLDQVLSRFEQVVKDLNRLLGEVVSQSHAKAGKELVPTKARIKQVGLTKR